MSTATDAGLEALLTGDPPEPEHGICAACYPAPVVPAGAIALCGYRFEAPEPVTDCSGLHKCARCLEVDQRLIYPCGH